MVTYVGDFMETSTMPELEDGQKALILVTHDESCFGSNDGRSYCWLDENNRQIRPKGNGKSMMISDFLWECHGILKFDHELQKQYPDIPADSTQLIISLATFSSTQTMRTWRWLGNVRWHYSDFLKMLPTKISKLRTRTLWQSNRPNNSV
jgi:hypothetical protein